MHHGWVKQNEDGSRTECGGPGTCRVCDVELDAYRAQTTEEQRKHAAGDSSAGRMEYLHDRISELVTKHGPQHVARGMKTAEVYEAIVACLEHLTGENRT